MEAPKATIAGTVQPRALSKLATTIRTRLAPKQRLYNALRRRCGRAEFVPPLVEISVTMPWMATAAPITPPASINHKAVDMAFAYPGAHKANQDGVLSPALRSAPKSDLRHFEQSAADIRTVARSAMR
jgi:hypothetical protein